MAAEPNPGVVLPFPARSGPVGPPQEDVADLRFRALLAPADWVSLPESTRSRFGKRVTECRTLLYSGEILECRMSGAGRVVAQLARLIGAPLPLYRDEFVPAMVGVTEDSASGGQLWTRVYSRRCGFPQVIRSSKRFCGPTGLEEYIGRGVGVALRVEVENGVLHFVSDHYYLQLLGARLRIPAWLSPGRLRVSHVDCNHGLFAFVLELRHGLLGELIRQTVMFADAAPEHDR